MQNLALYNLHLLCSKKLFFNEINPFRIYEMHFVREILLHRLFGNLTIVREDNMELIKKGVFGIYVKTIESAKNKKSVCQT